MNSSKEAIIGYGASETNKNNPRGAHGRPLRLDEIGIAKKYFGFPPKKKKF